MTVRVRRRSSLFTPTNLLLAVSVPALVLLVLALALGGLQLDVLREIPGFGWLGREARAEQRVAVDLENTVELPLTRVAIPAYTSIAREHYLDLQSGRPNTVRLPKDRVGEELVTMDDVLAGRLTGRVLARSKRAGFVFSWSDFLPKGSRAGVASGIPPGHRGIWVETARISGLAGLQVGDRFDIVGARARDLRPVAPPEANGDGVHAENLRRAAAAAPKSTRTEVELLVENGSVVVAERVRDVPVTSSGLMTGQRIATRPVTEAMLAVKPAELARLAGALAGEMELHCAPRSGHADEDRDAVTVLQPDEPTVGDPLEAIAGRFTSVEVIEGATRRQVTTPREGADR